MGLMQIPFLPETMSVLAPHTSQWLVRALAGSGTDALHRVDFDRLTVGPLNQYRAFARETILARTDSPRLKAPMLVLWGRDDGVLIPPSQAEWDRVAFQSTVRIVPGGHWLHRDRAEDVILFLETFIRNVLKVGECNG